MIMKTPKEEAQELVKKFRNLIAGLTRYQQLKNAKQCALICVNFTINDEFDIYWQSVKKEIELLK